MEIDLTLEFMQRACALAGVPQDALLERVLKMLHDESGKQMKAHSVPPELAFGHISDQAHELGHHLHAVGAVFANLAAASEQLSAVLPVVAASSNSEDETLLLAAMLGMLVQQENAEMVESEEDDADLEFGEDEGVDGDIGLYAVVTPTVEEARLGIVGKFRRDSEILPEPISAEAIPLFDELRWRFGEELPQAAFYVAGFSVRPVLVDGVASETAMIVPCPTIADAFRVLEFSAGQDSVHELVVYHLKPHLQPNRIYLVMDPERFIDVFGLDDPQD